MKTRVLASLTLALVLGGCFSVLPEPEIPSALISLPSDRAKAPADPLLADVAIYPPDSTRAFSGVDIAVRSDQEMVYLGDVRWVDTAPRLLQGAVVDALAKAEGEGRAAPAQLATRTDYDVRWRIVDFSVSKEAGPVHVKVEASLVDSASRRIIAQDSFEAEGTPTDRAPRARAAALAIAAQTVADQVAAFTTKNAVAKPPRPATIR
jgi:ABC-type uncharacterized transport system auxiliary subunit